MQPLHQQQHCSSDHKWEISHPEHRMCLSVATVHLRKVYVQIFLCNTYQIQIHLMKTDKHCYCLFTWLVTSFLVNQPETAERWSVSPAFARSALQNLRQRDFFLPSVWRTWSTFSWSKTNPSATSENSFKLLKWLSSDRTIFERLEKEQRQWDPILFPLDFSSKRAHYEDSDLVWTEAVLHEDCDLGYCHHRFGHRYFKILYEAQEFQEHGFDFTRRNKGKMAWIHTYKTVGFGCACLLFYIVIC